MTTIYNQNFGIEIELTGISRPHAARIIAEYFNHENPRTARMNDYYDSSVAYDNLNRKWRCMSDASVTHPSCEVVSPICTYEDIEHIQNIIRLLRRAGARADRSCGIHVHINGAPHTPDSISCLMTLMYSRQDLFADALGNRERMETWCCPINKGLKDAIKKAHSKDAIESVWYSPANVVRGRPYRGFIDHSHYNDTRYHNLNLHAYFTKGTLEFRMFNGTTHAGRIKTYIQFCLAASAWATTVRPSIWFTHYDASDAESKLAAMEDLLIRRFRMGGREFATARNFLTEAFRTA